MPRRLNCSKMAGLKLSLFGTYTHKTRHTHTHHNVTTDKESLTNLQHSASSPFCSFSSPRSTWQARAPPPDPFYEQTLLVSGPLWCPWDQPRRLPRCQGHPNSWKRLRGNRHLPLYSQGGTTLHRCPSGGGRLEHEQWQCHLHNGWLSTSLGPYKTWYCISNALFLSIL